MKWLENKKTPQNKKKGRKKKEQDRTEEQEAAAIFPGHTCNMFASDMLSSGRYW